MFDLSVDLARILELLALQLPGAFLRGSNLNLTRLVEVRPSGNSQCSTPCMLLFGRWQPCWGHVVQVLSFILSHTTEGPGAAMLDAALRLDLPLLKKLSRPLLLAPIVGAPPALRSCHRLMPWQSGVHATAVPSVGL